MDKPKLGELEGIALRFSQTGLAGHNDPDTMMLADIIRRLSHLENSAGSGATRFACIEDFKSASKGDAWRDGLGRIWLLHSL